MDPNVPGRIERSQNSDLRRGAVDGRIRFERPNAANAELTQVTNRNRVLHATWYGTFGVSEDAKSIIDAALPAAVPGPHPVRMAHGEIGYPMSVDLDSLF